MLLLHHIISQLLLCAQRKQFLLTNRPAVADKAKRYDQK